MGHRETLRTGHELDAASRRSRKILPWRVGRRHRVKRQLARRARK
jgi:hypothetical protein